MTGLPEGNERERFDRKSLRKVTGQTADWGELATDCIGFANGAGGKLYIGIEDDAIHPPPDQRIDVSLVEQIRKRIGELTVNVQALPELQRDENGGEYILLTVSRSIGIASPSDGRYYLRDGDSCKPVTGADVLRLANDRPALPWEAMTTFEVPRSRADAGKLSKLADRLRASDRVKASVKEKSNDELLDRYGLASGGSLTHLGILLAGTRADRARLGTAPVVRRIGSEIHEKTAARALEALVKEGEVEPQVSEGGGPTAWRSFMDKRRDSPVPGRP
jgi:ATP-dependent DNA helicase RecG